MSGYHEKLLFLVITLLPCPHSHSPFAFLYVYYCLDLIHLDRAGCSYDTVDRSLRKRVKSAIGASHEIWFEKVPEKEWPVVED